MDEYNNKIDDIVFFNVDGELVYDDRQYDIDDSIARMHDIVAKVIKKSPYVAYMYKDGWGMAKSLADRCPTFQELNFSDKTAVTLYKQGEYENGKTFYFNGQPTQLPKLFIKKKDAAFNIDGDDTTSDYANKNLVCLDDIKTEYTPKIITLVFHDMSIDETYIDRTFIFRVDSQIEDAPDLYEDEDPKRKYDYCTFDKLSTSTSNDGNYADWLLLIDDEGNHIYKHLVQPVELVSYANMGNPRILTVKLNYGNTLHVYFNGVKLYGDFQITDDIGNPISFNVNNHSYYKQYSYKIKGGEREYIKVTDNFDIQLNNIYDDTTIDIYGHYKDTCDIKINVVGDCSVYDTYELLKITKYNASNDYAEEHYYTFTNIMSPGYNYYTHHTHYNACDVSYPSGDASSAICKIGQTFYVSVDEAVYDKFYWKFTGTKKETDGTKTLVVFDSSDYAMKVYGYTKEQLILKRLNYIKHQNASTAEEFKSIQMKDNDYYGFFVPMDLKKHEITVDSFNPMNVESYPLNDFSIRNLYIEVSEKYKPKTVTFYIYDDMDVEMLKFNGDTYVIYNKNTDNKDKKFPYTKEIQTIDGDNMNITCKNATDIYAKTWYFITDNNKSIARSLGTYSIINAYDNMTVHLSLSKVSVAYMYITADSGISVVDINRRTNVVPTDGSTLYTTDATENSPYMLQAHFEVSSSDSMADVITAKKCFYNNSNELTETSSEQLSKTKGIILYNEMHDLSLGYYRISFKNATIYESKSATVMVKYSDGKNIIPTINGNKTDEGYIIVNEGNSEFKFENLSNDINYTLSLILSDDIKNTYPSATVRYKQRITETDIVSWKTASNMTSNNSYTVQIGGDYSFGKAKLLDIEITPQKVITYIVKIVNTSKLCKVYFWDYVNEEYQTPSEDINITHTTTVDFPNKFKVKFEVNRKDLYKFYSLLYVSPSGSIEHESNNNRFNADGFAEYEDLFVAENDYVLTITPINENKVYLTFPNNSTSNELDVTTETAENISNGKNSLFIYKKYVLGDDKDRFTINGLPEGVLSVNLHMYGSNIDNINNIIGWNKVDTKPSISVEDGSVSFDYMYKYGFYSDDGNVGEQKSYKYYRIGVQTQSDYVFAVDTEKTEPCPGLQDSPWNIYITKSAPSGVTTSISMGDISFGEEPRIILKGDEDADVTSHSNFSEFFNLSGTIIKESNGKFRITLSPKRNLDEFVISTHSEEMGTRFRYLKKGDVIKELIKIDANDVNYSQRTIYVDCVIGLMITLEWGYNKMENGIITVDAPWNSGSKKLLYFNCKDSNGNIISLNVLNNFVDESNSFTKSKIYPSKDIGTDEITGVTETHTLELRSDSSVLVGKYQIGVKYNTHKQISAIINVYNTKNYRYCKYNVVVSNVLNGYILSTALSITANKDVKTLLSLNGTEWLTVRFTETSATPYTFIGVDVYNESCEPYTQISNNDTGGTNLNWGSKIYVLVHVGGNRYSKIGEGFDFSSSWSAMDTNKTL